ncbi:hypothetical protein [Evansella cellulosilytica]|uniref:Uncharacterized protein n=1 Tax=Evansella cellulosilytica (strain ATCC 21833 / DSM 2522 / FERM P-1141 / JCM 9156 / N-4) TaxID=649639 RepID=E6TQH4_EVAC2|nr:hypothetical protein [Evansella cellulosilytica]ADU29352.1 hypothetical protein Bcell_1082 [Evansella cellulosilytica DSM 2522]
MAELTISRKAHQGVKRVRRARIASAEGVNVMDKRDIRHIQEELGFNNTKPISLSPSDQKDVDDKGDCFRDWYEEELRELYER